MNIERDLVWGISLTLILLFAKLIIDFNQREDGKLINHKLEWRVLALLSCFPIYFFTIASSFYFFVVVPVAGGMIAFFIWIFFDGLYNLSRGYNWWFTGTDDPDDAAMDNFLQKLTLNQHKSIKIFGFLLFTILYIITLR